MLYQVECPDPFRWVKAKRTPRKRHDAGVALDDLLRMASEGRLDFRLQINAGLRPAELPGLRVEDVQGNVVHVRRSRSYCHGQWINHLPKTGVERRVPIGQALAQCHRPARRTGQARAV